MFYSPSDQVSDKKLYVVNILSAVSQFFHSPWASHRTQTIILSCRSVVLIILRKCIMEAYSYQNIFQIQFQSNQTLHQ